MLTNYIQCYRKSGYFKSGHFSKCKYLVEIKWLMVSVITLLMLSQSPCAAIDTMVVDCMK